MNAGAMRPMLMTIFLMANFSTANDSAMTGETPVACFPVV